MSLPNVCCITATYNRHFHLERVVRYFLDQDYKGDHVLLIYNNHPLSQDMAPLKLPSNKRILLVNNSRDYHTGKKYTTLGDIYRDALTHVPRTTDIVVHTDDDDIFLPYHISEGVKGYWRAKDMGKKAYKPEKSFFKDTEKKIHLTGNTMEPSIFVNAEHLFKYGYKSSTTDQHFSWLDPLRTNNELLVDPNGTPSLIYTWVGDVWKTSGNTSTENFNICRSYKGEVGDRVITPITSEEAKEHYRIG